MEGGKLVTITGNTFSGIVAEAVKGDENTEKVLVTGNIISDWGRGREDAEPIALPEGQGKPGQRQLDRRGEVVSPGGPCP